MPLYKKIWNERKSLGTQYESNKDLFKPCDTVCDMYKAKIDFLVKKYTELGVFDCLSEFPETKDYVNLINKFKADRARLS